MASTINASTSGGLVTTADTSGVLQLQTANTTAVTIDASQNVGVGVTPSAWASGIKALQLGSYSSLYDQTGATVVGNNFYNIVSGSRYLNTAAATAFVQESGKHIWYNAPSGTAGNTITFTQAMTLDASGNLGVGSTSPNIGGVSKAVTLNTTNGSSGAIYEIAANGTNYAYFFANATNTVLSSVLNLPLLFNTNNTERARITSGGEFYIAGTTDQGAYNLQVAGTGVWGAGAYVNGSDARIKEEIAPIDSGLDVVQKLNPVTYKYKEDWTKDRSTQTGFIAQELQVALEGKNYVDGIVQQGGSEGYYSVAYQNIIPILTKAIQELKAELDQAKAEIATLKGA